MTNIYTIFYDGRCGLCNETRNRLEQTETSATMKFVDINNRRALADYPQVDPGAAQGQMHVLSPSGQLSGGFEALLTIGEVVPTIRAVVPYLKWKPIRALGEVFYRWMARNRLKLFGQIPCHDGACRI